MKRNDKDWITCILTLIVMTSVCFCSFQRKQIKKKFLLRVSTKHRILDTCRQCVAVYFVRNEEEYNFSHYEVKYVYFHMFSVNNVCMSM